MLSPPVATLAALLFGAASACGSSTTNDAAGDLSEAGPGCDHPGTATPGPPDTHCQLADGGMRAQSVDPASCDLVAPTDGGNEPFCPYGATIYGQEGDEDNCKFHVTWQNLTPICELAGGVSFQVTVTRKTDGAPVVAATPEAEVFTTTPGDWDGARYCDTESTHLGPNSYAVLFTENPPGTYTGPIVFDRPGQWTVRFHFFGTCYDAPDSPHGHAAFHVTVP